MMMAGLPSHVDLGYHVTNEVPRRKSSSTESGGAIRIERLATRSKIILAETLPQQLAKGQSRKQSMKFSAKSFITSFSDDLEKHYEIGELLGEGGYGHVYACKYKETGAIRAVKVIAKSDDAEKNQMVIQEFNILKELDHPNILKNYALFENKDSFYIVTDLYKGGELFRQLGNAFSEEDVAVLMKSFLSCINYCHKQGIAHRDLKPENILLEENKDLTAIKVIDFGLARNFHDDSFKFTTVAGSSYYMSPQVIQGRYNHKCDTWSMGVICYMLFAGFAPFDGDSEEEILDRIKEGTVYFNDPVWDNISDEALDFIVYLLTYDENDRPTAEEALLHPWIQESWRSEDEELSERNSARESLAGLKSFNASFKLKQCVCCLIASQLLPKEDRDEINQVFRAIDLDCDGKLTAENFKLSYKSNFGVDLSDEDVQAIFQEVNYSGSGAIEYSEFIVSSMLEKNLVTEPMLEMAFNMLDRDESGLLDFEDFKEVLAVDDEMETYVKTRIIEPVDTDGDGLISLEDFKGMFADELNTEERNPNRYREVPSVAVTHKPLIRMSLRDSFRTSVKMTNSMNCRGLDQLDEDFGSGQEKPRLVSHRILSTTSASNGALKNFLDALDGNILIIEEE